MNRYVYDKNGIFTGRVLRLTKFDTFPVYSTELAPPGLVAGEYAKFNGSEWEVITELPTDPIVVPGGIELRQLKLALHNNDLLQSVEVAINALPAAKQKVAEINWNNGGTVNRVDAANLTQGVINENMLDNLFIEGQSL